MRLEQGPGRRVRAFACRLLLLVLLCFPVMLAGVDAVHARTGLPLPRFVSIDADRANLRVGPGTRYPIVWVYVRAGVPVQIFQEYGAWRRIRDRDGATGWIHSALLSGERTAFVVGKDTRRFLPVFAGPGKNLAAVAKVQPGLLVHLDACVQEWCSVSIPERDVSGFLPRAQLWGVLPGEQFGSDAWW